MATPTVDTFEHDIANEIRHKEASITDIASAVGDLGNTENETPKSTVPLIGAVVVLIICGILGAVYIGYTSYTSGLTPNKTQIAAEVEQKKNTSGAQLGNLSPTLNQAIGSFLTNVQKSKTGYSMNITSYSPVFAYMIKNESLFADELGLALGNTKVIAKVTEQPAATTTVQTTVSTTTAQGTSTRKVATSTAIVIEPKLELPEEYIFSDVTISNQNMRIAKSTSGTIVYAFIGSQRLVISTSTEGILALRSSLLQK